MADTAKHTPGPWLVRKAANGDRGISAPGTGIFIEVFTEIRHSGEGALDECEANARLVVAAPDLLEFAKHVLDCIRKNGEYAPLVTERVREVIAKAEGRS
jgi:hypothetical protein